MEHEWIVTVKDEAGAAVTNAAVALVPASAIAGLDFPFSSVASTHQHKGGGTYETPPSKPIVPVAGPWVLIVRKKGKSPVVQPLKMTAKSKVEMLTTPAPRTAATIAFRSEVKIVDASKVRRTGFAVTLFKSAERVFLSGTDYFEGKTRFRIFAENHAIGLRREKVPDNGTIITLFSCDDRARDTLVYSTSGALLKVASKSFGPTAGMVFGPKRVREVGIDISVVTLYQYLSSVGASDPGRVKEVGFFAHSFPGGPILFDTGDDDSVPGRLPDDFDGRRKDFNATNSAGWPKMKAAMAADGRWQVWGCSATVHNKNLAAAAHRHKKDGDDALFTVQTTSKHHDGRTSQKIEERTTRAGVRRNMDRQIRGSTYMSAAATFLGISVFGAPPGVGASFAQASLKGSPDLNIMFINVGETPDVYAYFKEDFAPDFVPTNTPYDKGYVDYRPLASRPPAPLPPFSSERYRFVINFADALSTPPSPPQTSIAFAAGNPVIIASDKVTLRITAKTGFLTPNKTGHLYELICTDDSLSRAAFVQEDQRAVHVLRGSSGQFTVIGRPL